MERLDLTRRSAIAAVASAATAGLVLRPGSADAADSMRAQRADSFLDSVGIQTHMSYHDTPYSDVPSVAFALTELGARHVRDDLKLNRPDLVAALNSLASVGIGSTLIMGNPIDPPPSTFVSVLAGIRGVDAAEGTNEWDLQGGSWAPAVYQRQRDLLTSMRADPATAGIPLLGPAMGFITNLPTLAAVGPIGAVSDLGNVHEYGGGKPVGPVLQQAKRAMRTYQPGQPVIVTETGYHNALHGPPGHPSVPMDVAAVYVPRVFLENFRAGIYRTFLYELVDEFVNPGLTDLESHFGLVRHDFSPKPAYKALRTLLRLTEDAGAPFTPRPLKAAIQGPRDLRRLVLQKRDGSHVVVLWRDVSIWNTRGRRRERVRSQTVRLGFPGAKAVRVYRPTGGSKPVVDTRTSHLRLSLDGDIAVAVVGGRRGRDYARPLA